MTDDAFNNPAAGGKFNAQDHNGKLLIIKPTGYKTGVSTTFGEKDVVEAEVVVVDEKTPADSEVIDGAYLFGGVLIGQTKPFINKGLVLGRLGQKPTDKGNPAWILKDATDEDRKAANDYLQSTAPKL